MHTELQRNLFLVKEHIGMFKAANNFDVHDVESGQIILECREERLGGFTKLLRFTDYKRYTPFDVVVKTPDGRQVLRVSRGVTFLRSKVSVFDENDERVGGFQQKLMSIGGKFAVLDDQDREVCMLQGKWTSWSFEFKDGQDQVMAKVAKKWSGLGKELFTSADNYMLQIDESVPAGHPARYLILGAVLCIDMVLKE